VADVGDPGTPGATGTAVVGAFRDQLCGLFGG
jgi:hypothetical protein